jgi:hypothetical protein
MEEAAGWELRYRLPKRLLTLKQTSAVKFKFRGEWLLAANTGSRIASS